MRFLKEGLLGLIMTLLFVAPTFAQDGEEITDDALWRYALLETSVEQMKKDISVTINQMIKDQDGIDGKRYKELAKTKGDEAKLAEIEAQEFEIKFLELVDKVKAERIEAIKEVNQELATKMVGNKGKTYKAIKTAVKSDEAMKTRYEAIKASVAAPSSSDSESK